MCTNVRREANFSLVGIAYSQLGIGDFERDARHVIRRYFILITPAWAQDQRRPGNFRTCQRLMGSSGLGGVRGAQWGVYGRGPTDSNFEFSPFTSYIRVIHNGYADDGPPCAEDPTWGDPGVGYTQLNGQEGGHTFGIRRVEDEAVLTLPYS